MVKYCIIFGTVLIDLVLSLNVATNQERQNVETKGHDAEKQKSLRRVLKNLALSKMFLTNSNRRAIDAQKLARAKALLTKRADIQHNVKVKTYVREHVHVTEFPSAALNTEYAGLVEKELKDTESKHSSLLLDKAFVEKTGRNDYLVIQMGTEDPFVTIIPNNIYYNIEKKCVNWLDDCTIQGIRARLLQRVNSPYK